jgi:hypothetical protein
MDNIEQFSRTRWYNFQIPLHFHLDKQQQSWKEICKIFMKNFFHFTYQSIVFNTECGLRLPSYFKHSPFFSDIFKKSLILIGNFTVFSEVNVCSDIFGLEK